VEVVSIRAFVLVAVASVGLVACGGGVAANPCEGSHRAHCGTMDVRSHYVRGVFVEGAVISVKATDGSEITLHGPGPARMFVHAGRVRLHATVSPCDANCSHLDPPLRCTASFDIGPHQSARVTVVVSDGRRCQIVWWV
jgi:hypothetical protein